MSIDPREYSKMRELSALVTADLSPMRLTCLLFVMHTLANSLLLSAINGKRCLFWEKSSLSSDESWIANWYSFSHFHVGILLIGLCFGAPEHYDIIICNIVLAIITIYFAEGIFSIELLEGRLVYLQVAVLVILSSLISFFSWEYERNRPRIELIRKLTTTTSFDRRKKISIATLAVAAQFVGSLFRLVDMVLGDGRKGYLGDTSSPIYQNISSMALCDMMIVTVILGATIRFFEAEAQKSVLWAQVLGLFVSLVMLTTGQGEMLVEDQQKAGGVGTFISILTAVVGAL